MFKLRMQFLNGKFSTPGYYDTEKEAIAIAHRILAMFDGEYLSAEISPCD